MKAINYPQQACRSCLYIAACKHEHVVAYAGTAVVPPMTTSSLRLGKWLTEYAHLMRVIRSDAGRIWSGMAELFELYFLHTFHTFGDITIAALMSTQQQRQVLHRFMSHRDNPARHFGMLDPA